MKKIVLVFLIIFSQSALSQSFSVFDVDYTDFPLIKAQFIALDQNKEHILDFTTDDFIITENGVERTPLSVSCPDYEPPKSISAVITIDISGSMTGPNIQNAKKVAHEFLNFFETSEFESALTTFNTRNFINQDFTTDESRVHAAIDKVGNAGGTDFNAGFINQLSGALLVAEKAKYKKIIVFITDGYANGNTEEIIKKAKEIDATVFCIIVGTLNYVNCLNPIAEETGGDIFNYYDSDPNLKAMMMNVYNKINETGNCEITWMTDECLEDNLINLQIKCSAVAKAFSNKLLYPFEKSAQLLFDPDYIKFISVGADKHLDTSIIITARNSDFDIVNVKCSNPAFSISPDEFSLLKNESLELKISYLAEEAGYQYTEFEFENSLCNFTFRACAGWSFSDEEPVVRTLKLLHPNGAEVFVAGSDTVITWEGIPPEEPVSIEYRVDDNSPWKKLSDTAKGLSFKFRVPVVTGDQFLARVSMVSDQSYSEVEICNQTWMDRNLNVDYYANGDPIVECNSPEEWIHANNNKTGAWCYYNFNPTNSYIYGKLYNWYAVNDPRGIAPIGWHIPDDEEWDELEDCLKYNTGGKLKSTETLYDTYGYWAYPNKGATNESNFTALPGGYVTPGCSFVGINFEAYWWTASEINGIGGISRDLDYDSDDINRHLYYLKGCGLSVRCVKD